MQEAGSYGQADAELNRIYNKLLGQYDKGEQDLLRKAENAWIIMRESEAELAVSHTQRFRGEPHIITAP